MMRMLYLCVGLVWFAGSLFAGEVALTPQTSKQESPTKLHKQRIPKELHSYHDEHLQSVGDVLRHRIQQEPFNLLAALVFFLAIVHTFVASKFKVLAQRLDLRHLERIREGIAARRSKHLGAGFCHFLGEVEAIFGTWVIVLIVVIAWCFDWGAVVEYIDHYVVYVEPIFVVVIMTLAATRPILFLSEGLMKKCAQLFGGGLGAWWFCILTVGPVLGSFITEPAAMTISAMLLAQKFYALGPTRWFRYGTLALLFVNVSVGGTLTNFAAPPVLMVVKSWGWSSIQMIEEFGWKAIVGILCSNALYFFYFRSEVRVLQEKYARLQREREIQRKCNKKLIEERFQMLAHDLVGDTISFDKQFFELTERYRTELKHETLAMHKDIEPGILSEGFDVVFNQVRDSYMKEQVPVLLSADKRPKCHDPEWDLRDDRVPWWMVVIHVLFLLWAVVNSHHPVLCVGGFLVFLSFAKISEFYQNRIQLQPALLVGFFLAGLVTHGNLQSWWITPVLSQLGEVPLMLGATMLTAFNDNAAITYLATLVPGLSDGMKYMVVAGALTGGGLTVIANAPNPAGQSILKQYFEEGVSPLFLLLAACIPTLIMALLFIFLAP